MALPLTFGGLGLASVFYSLGVTVHSVQNAFEEIGERPPEVAATLGFAINAFFNVALSLMRPGLITASILIFVHTVGEFGIVFMIGGSLPSVTRGVPV